jgi:hypothetical protein
MNRMNPFMGMGGGMGNMKFMSPFFGGNMFKKPFNKKSMILNIGSDDSKPKQPK